MQGHAVGIVGASGYAGMEATRLLAAHRGVVLRFLTSDRWEGETAGAKLGISGAAAALRYAPLARSEELAAECEAVLLATPATASVVLVPRLLERGVRVVDFSGAFRLAEPLHYPAYYGFVHPRPDLLAQAAYGLPELFRSQIRGARLVANPGCYATAAALALAPLAKRDLIEGDVVVDAASGVTGAGRTGREDLAFAEVDGDFRAYKVLRHPHTPEIAQTTDRCGLRSVHVTFTAHLLPVRRGILATAYGRLRPGAGPEAVADAMRNAYGAEPFVVVRASPEEVGINAVAGTNRCDLGAAAGEDGRVIVVAALDNLVKGAAGQAVQNLNLVLGLPEAAGMYGLRSFWP